MGRSKESTDFLKECIADALIKLLKEKPIQKITIPELVKTAEVGRNTYFRHFNKKEDLISYKLVLLWHRWAEENNIIVRTKFSIDNAKSFFEFNLSIKNLLILLYSNGLQSTIYDAFNQVLMPIYRISADECYESRFYSTGLFGLLDEWVRRDFSETPVQMEKILKGFLGKK